MSAGSPKGRSKSQDRLKGSALATNSQAVNAKELPFFSFSFSFFFFSVLFTGQDLIPKLLYIVVSPLSIVSLLVVLVPQGLNRLNGNIQKEQLTFKMHDILNIRMKSDGVLCKNMDHSLSTMSSA